MAYSQQQIDDFQALIDTGQISGMYSDGSQWQFRSLDEMRSILADMKAKLAGPGVSRARTIRVNTRSGF